MERREEGRVVKQRLAKVDAIAAAPHRPPRRVAVPREPPRVWVEPVHLRRVEPARVRLVGVVARQRLVEPPEHAHPRRVRRCRPARSWASIGTCVSSRVHASRALAALSIACCVLSIAQEAIACCVRLSMPSIATSSVTLAEEEAEFGRLADEVFETRHKGDDRFAIRPQSAAKIRGRRLRRRRARAT